MKQKAKFIVYGVVVPILFIIILSMAIIISLQNKSSEIKETESVVMTSDNEKITETTIQQTSESDTADYEVEKFQSKVSITAMTEHEIEYLGKDKATFEQKMNEFIVGYGYQNCEEVRLEESEYNEEEQVFIMTFVIKTHLSKDPYIVVKYQKKNHTFDIQIW